MTWKRTLILAGLMLLTWAVTILAARTEDIRLNRSFDEFPDRIGQWQGQKGALDDGILNVLGVEDYVLANYGRTPKQAVNLYIGFYQSQREGDLIHSPKNCMPGAGWRILRTQTEMVPQAGSFKPFKAAKLLLEKGAEKQVVLYWFQSRGRMISSEYMQKIWLVVDAVTKQRTDGSFVRLITPVVTNEAAALELLKEFAMDIRPVLDDFIPS